MINIDNNVKLTIFVMLFSSYIIYEKKPGIMFNEKGEFKSFGLNESNNETIFPFYISILLLSFLVYYCLLLRGGNYV
jgi:hypothetical protein